MPSYYKTARRWEREHEAALRGRGPELNYVRDKTTGEFKLPPRRQSPVPPTGRQNGISGLPTAPSQPYKDWKDFTPGGRATGNLLGKWRGAAGGILGFIADNQDEFAKWDRKTWDDFIEDGTLPPPFDFLNPDPNVLDRYLRENNLPPIPRKEPEMRSPVGWMNTTPDAPASASDGVYRWAFPSGSVENIKIQANVLRRIAEGTRTAQFFPNAYREAGGFISPADYDNIVVSATTPIVWSLVPDRQWLTLSSVAASLRAGPQDIERIKNWPLIFRPAAGETPAQFVAALPPLPTGRTVYKALPNTSFGVDFNARTPMRFAPLLKAAQIAAGVRTDSGYDPDKAPWVENPTTVITVPVPQNPGGGGPTNPSTTTKPKPPYKPPGTKNERKARVIGRGAFAAAQKGLHGLTEYQDFISSFYDALPKHLQTCKKETPQCMTSAVIRNWDKFDIAEAVANWIWNEIEDRIAGRGFGALDKASRNLGQRDWKFFNGAADNPTDQAIGELIGEFSGAVGDPTKEAFVSWMKGQL